MDRTVSVMLPAAALFLGACASSGSRPAPAPSAAMAAPKTALSAADAADYRHTLEEAYTRIVERSGKPDPSIPEADVDAILSIPIPEQPSIRGALSYFSTDLHDSIQVSLTRSGRYRKIIDRVLDEYKLPHGLAYLPVIESAYVPTLTSRAGAHGIWQFMSETAREYNLRVDWWVDERADPERSARAAASYLRDLYHQFNDWPLALAAYNAGPGRIRRAMDDSGARTFWELSDGGVIPKETRGYVPTFFATLLIVSDPATYGFQLGEALDPVDEKIVELEGPVTLRFVAEIAGMHEADLRELNPAMRRAVLPPGPSQLRLPARSAGVVAEKSASLRIDDPYIALTRFTAREGDTLKRLAKAAGTTVDTLARMNGLSASHKLRRGDPLYLPVRSRELAAALASPTTIYHAVSKGETLYSIAHHYHLTIDELVDLNQLDDDQPLRVGRKLRVKARGISAAGGM
jgi:membrane-bound lytic murein transglycosylase D